MHHRITRVHPPPIYLEAGAAGALDNGLDHAVGIVGGKEDVGLAGVVLVLDAELGEVHGDVVDVGLCVGWGWVGWGGSALDGKEQTMQALQQFHDKRTM